MIKLIFLGTSDGIPTKKRNHSAIILNYDEETILVDCGEGTQRQLRIAGQNPFKITKILLTHLHADHTLGLAGLLATLSLGSYNKTLKIYGPKGTKNFLKKLFELFEFKPNFNLEVEEVHKKFFENEKFYLESEKMEHNIPCNAYSFVLKNKRRIDKEKLKKLKIPSSPLLKKLKEGKNIKFSGKSIKYKELTYLEPEKKISFILDTKINKKTYKISKNSDILICESTFEKNLEEKAKEHFHLTTKQAGEIAKKSNCKKLILTHLSGRYENDEEKMLIEAKKYFKNTILAHDFDNFSI